VEFWHKKLNGNVERDARDIDCLRKLDWRVAVVWECAMRLLGPEQVAGAVAEWLLQPDKSLVLPRKLLGRLPKE
jgi:DNA mismatch endonuclease (patch repair protein)